MPRNLNFLNGQQKT